MDERRWVPFVRVLVPATNECDRRRSRPAVNITGLPVVMGWNLWVLGDVPADEQGAEGWERLPMFSQIGSTRR